jgi:hypothetical protein
MSQQKKLSISLAGASAATSVALGWVGFFALPPIGLTFGYYAALFFVRHLIALLGALVFQSGSLRAFLALFVAPPIVCFHACWIIASHGELELWPPVLFLDLVFFFPAAFLYRRRLTRLI